MKSLARKEAEFKPEILPRSLARSLHFDKSSTALVLIVLIAEFDKGVRLVSIATFPDDWKAYLQESKSFILLEANSAYVGAI